MANDYGPVQAAKALGIKSWQWREAVRLGLVCAADSVPALDGGEGRWSAAVVEEVRGRLADVVEGVGKHTPIGNWSVATRLTAELGVEANGYDVEDLEELGLLPAACQFKGSPLYAAAAIDRLIAEHADAVADVVAERQHWEAASLYPREARAQLGLSEPEWSRVVQERGLAAGPRGRYARADVDAVREDGELVDAVRADRRVNRLDACTRLRIRASDFQYLLRAGRLQTTGDPKRVKLRRVGWVNVPMYRVGDLDALRADTSIDWAAVDACKPGDASPLRALVSP